MHLLYRFLLRYFVRSSVFFWCCESTLLSAIHFRMHRLPVLRLHLRLTQLRYSVRFFFTAICGLLIEAVRSRLKQNTDLVLSVILTLSVGIAITLISSGLSHGNADAFLFGSVLTVSTADIVTVIILSTLAIITFCLKYQELLYVIVDENLAQVAGVKVKVINYLFSLLVSVTVAVAIKIVGMMVLGSLLTMPVAAALQLKKGFKRTLFFQLFLA